MNNKGWVKLWREQFEHAISDKKPWCDGYAWCYLYSKANYKKGIVNFRNEYIEIKRGQFLTSQYKLAEKWGWTRKHVKSFLNTLKIDKMLTYRTTYRFMIITILNYERYQSLEDNNGTTERTTGDPTGAQQATLQEHTIEEELKKENKKRIIKEVKEKKLFGAHTLLTDEEYQKLIDRFGKDIADDWIVRVNLYAEQKAKKFKEYTSHYATILTWDRIDKEREGKSNKPKTITSEAIQKMRENLKEGE